MEAFVNLAWAELGSDMDASQTSMTLKAGHGVRFGTIDAGYIVRCAILNQSNFNVAEVVYISEITGDVATVIRGQDGTTGVAHLAGSRVENRVGKSTLQKFVQYEPSITSQKTAPVSDDEVLIGDSENSFVVKRMPFKSISDNATSAALVMAIALG